MEIQTTSKGASGMKRFNEAMIFRPWKFAYLQGEESPVLELQ